MASGDTKTQQYLDVAANGTRADLPSDTCCETRTQTLIRGVAERIMDVEDEVERLENNPDVVDIVDTYADLQAYDTSTLTNKDIIRVLADETHSDNSTYYRWNDPNSGWNFIGEISGGGGINVVQTTGTSTTDVMSQDAVTKMVFANGSTYRVQIGLNTSSTTGNSSSIAIGTGAGATKTNSIAIGTSATASSGNSLAVGWNSVASNGNGVALGRQTTASGENSIAIGWNATATQKGQFDISTGANQQTAGYNDSNYRLLTGLYDPQSAHDAATKGYVDGLVGNIEAALNAINNGGN